MRKQTWSHLCQGTYSDCSVLGQQDADGQLAYQVGYDGQEEQSTVPQVGCDQRPGVTDGVEVPGNELVLVCHVEDTDGVDSQVIWKSVVQVGLVLGVKNIAGLIFQALSADLVDVADLVL